MKLTRAGHGKAAGQIAAWGVQCSATTKPRVRKEQKNTAGMTEISCTKQWQPAGGVQPEQAEKKPRLPTRKPGSSWKQRCWLARLALHSSSRGVGTQGYHATLKTIGNSILAGHVCARRCLLTLQECPYYCYRLSKLERPRREGGNGGQAWTTDQNCNVWYPITWLLSL